MEIEIIVRYHPDICIEFYVVLSSILPVVGFADFVTYVTCIYVGSCTFSKSENSRFWYFPKYFQSHININFYWNIDWYFPRISSALHQLYIRLYQVLIYNITLSVYWVFIGTAGSRIINIQIFSKITSAYNIPNN